MNIQSFYKIYWYFQSLIIPSLKYSQDLYENVIVQKWNKNYRWLDIGCGHQLFPEWRFNKEKELILNSKLIVGIDYDFNSLKKHRTIDKRIRGNIKTLPFNDNFFDFITSNMVFEHLDDPELQVKEIARVLKPGGILIFHTPNSIGYTTILAKMIPERFKDFIINILQGRKEEDVFPAYYRINHEKKIRQIAEIAGLDVSEIKMICSSAQMVLIPPLAIVELIWIRFLMSNAGRKIRTNIIAILQKTK